MRLVASQAIRVPPPRAFEVFADVEHSAGRVKGILRAEVISEVRAGKGLRWRETRSLFGKDATVEKEITAVDAPRSFRVESQVDGTNYVSTYTFAQGADPGSSVVTWTHDSEPLTLGAKLMSPMSWVFRGALRRFMAQDLADLAAFLEAPDT